MKQANNKSKTIQLRTSSLNILLQVNTEVLLQNGTVTVEVVTPPESYAIGIYIFWINKCAKYDSF